MPSEKPVRKKLRINQSKIDRAMKILGTKTETETIERALDIILEKAPGSAVARNPGAAEAPRRPSTTD